MALSEDIAFDQFEAWYMQYLDSYWEPARKTISRVVAGLLDDRLDERQRTRITVHDGRVKNPYRLWLKAHRDKYWSDIAELDDVVRFIDDIVGTRLICLTLSDVANALDVLRQLPVYEPGGVNALPLFRVDESERDYIKDVKASGYRAHHINLIVNVQHHSQFVPIQCEVQVRTLLQDSWGELTHEDTYKQGAPIPELVSSMSRVMADMLTAIDGLADEIAAEIARIEEIQDVSGAGDTTEVAAAPAPGPLLDAVAAHLETQWRGLDGPMSLASLADAVRREFGQEVGQDWLGMGGFKELITKALPDARINPAPPGYLLPSSATNASLVSAIAAYKATDVEGVPAVVAAIRQSDPSFPAIRSDQLDCMFDAMSAALAAVPVEGEPDIRWLNAVTKCARDIASEGEAPLGRGHFNYLAHMLRYTGALIGRPDSDSGGVTVAPEELRKRFYEQTIALTGIDGGANADSLDEILHWTGLDR